VYGVTTCCAIGTLRMDAYAVLGSRLDLVAELSSLTPLVERIREADFRRAHCVRVPARM
jgi:hypothetical protein